MDNNSFGGLVDASLLSSSVEQMPSKTLSLDRPEKSQASSTHNNNHSHSGSHIQHNHSNSSSTHKSKRSTLTNKTKKQMEEDGKGVENFPAKVAVKQGFGCSTLATDAILSYSSIAGDKDVNDKLVYRIGKQAIIYDVDGNRQYFLNGRPKSVTNVIHLSISMNARYLSVCESVRMEKEDLGHAQVSVYSLTTYARIKTIVHNCSGEFICSTFSGDAKYLATLNDGHEYQLILWQWEKEKVFKSITLQYKPTRIGMPHSQIEISGSGINMLKYWYVAADGALKMGSFLSSSKENENFVDHKWLPTTDMHRMIAVSDHEIITTEGFIRKNSIYVFEGLDAQPGATGPPINLEHRQTIPLKHESSHVSVEAITPYSKGFILCGRDGYVSFFDKLDDKRDPYFESRVLSLGSSYHFIASACLPSDDKLVLMTKLGKLLSVNTGNQDLSLELSSATEITATDLHAGGYHDQTIVAMDIALHRSIFATVSIDCSLRVWNYESMKCDLYHNFGTEDVYGVALHPTGFQVIVSFKEKVRLYNILLDKLKLHRETTAKTLKEIKFCSSGQYWAAASSINVSVYDTRTFHLLVTFQGHMMAIKRLSWGPGDQVLFSAGADGNIYGWNLINDTRLDVVMSNNRSAGIFDVAVDGIEVGAIGTALDRKNGRLAIDWANDPATGALTSLGTNCVFISYNDGTIRLNEWQPISFDSSPNAKLSMSSSMSLASADNAVRHKMLAVDDRDIDNRTCLTAVLISADKKFLYAGTTEGSLRIYEWPFVVNNSDAQPPFVESCCHSSPIIDIRECSTGKYVISSADDGTIFIHNIVKGTFASLGGSVDTEDGLLLDMYANMQGNAANGTDLTSAFNNTVVQVSKEDIEDHVQEVFELKKKIEEISTKFSFDLHQRENANSDEIKRLVDRHQVAINVEKEKFEHMVQKMESRIRELQVAIEHKSQDHVKMTAELENRYEHKLADQLDRYDRLGEEMELLKQRCEGLIAAERQEFERQLNEIKNETRQREKRMRMENKRIRDDRSSDENAFREILDQQDEEYEDELRQLIGAAEAELHSERETITKLRTLVQTKNTKLDQLKKKLTELAASAKARQALLLHERKERQKLQDTIEHYKKNLLEREEALAEKEKTILDLRSTTRTLENFRFVLDHRLQQLSAERGPITQHIESLEQHVRTMYEELVDEFEQKKDDVLKAEAKDLKISSFAHEVQLLRYDNRQKDLYIATFRRELENVIGAFGQKELEAAVKQLYRKFVRGERVQKELKVSHAGGDTMKMLLTKEESDDEDDLGSLADGLRSIKGASTLNNSTLNKHGGGKKVNKQAIIQEVEQELVESALEANRQKTFVEKNCENLKHRLVNTKNEAARINRIRLNENSHLIFECNELRKEVKMLQRKLEVANQALLEAQSGRGAGAGLGGTAGTGGLQTSSQQKYQPLSPAGGLNDFDESSEITTEMRMAGSRSVAEALGQPIQPQPTDDFIIEDDENGRGSRPQTGGSGRFALHEVVTRTMSRGAESESAPNLLTVPTHNQRHGHADIRSGVLQHSQTVPQLEVAGGKVSSVTRKTKQSHGHGKGGQVEQEPSSSVLLSASQSAALSTMKTPGKKTGAVNDQANKQLHKKDIVISQLHKEIQQLANQLDEAQREKTMQRTELARMRGLLAQAFTAPPSNTGPSIPMKLKESKYFDGGGNVLTLGNKAQTVAINRNLTHADVTGMPSKQDIHDIGLHNSLPKSTHHPQQQHPQATQGGEGKEKEKDKNGDMDSIAGSSISSKGSLGLRLPLGIDSSRSK